MGITLEWDDPAETILHYTFDRVWTWTDFDRAQIAGQAMIGQRDRGSIDVIIDAPYDVQLPANFLAHALVAFRTRHPRVRTVVACGGSPFTRTIVSAVRLVKNDAHEYFTVVATLEEARAIIQARRGKAERTG